MMFDISYWEIWGIGKTFLIKGFLVTHAIVFNWGYWEDATIYLLFNKLTPLSTLYNSLILKGLKFNNFLAKNCKPSIYRALEKRVESQVSLYFMGSKSNDCKMSS